ncbi:hypothetical protein PG997_000116 [Apiospora hydei]|uniref:Gag protein n=1 Tax=Apiospora hydei TaxID=1337664 RepID=A0ABR1X9W3_9PEZI
MANNDNTQKTYFKSPDDWDTWGSEFRKKAKALEIWEYIDPERKIDWMSPPRRPLLVDYPQRQGQPNRRSSIHVGGGLASDQEDPPARSITDLTDTGRSSFQLDYTMYTHEAKEYKDHRNKVEKLSDWVLSTVSDMYKKTCCDENNDLDGWYAALREVGKVQDSYQMTEAREVYRASTKPLRNMPRDFNAWVIRWETAMADGIRKGVPETTNSQAWCQDLIFALRPVMENWVTNFQFNRQEDINSGQIEYRKVASDLRVFWKTITRDPPASRVSKGSFATFGEADEEELYGQAVDQGSNDQRGSRSRTNNASKGTPAQSRKDGPKTGTKRKKEQTDQEESECGACFGNHTLSNCFYLFPDKAFQGWRASRPVQRVVEHNLSTHTKLAEKVKRLRKLHDSPDQ